VCYNEPQESPREKELLAKDCGSGVWWPVCAAGCTRSGQRAAPQLGFGQAACVTYIPREWGEYQGGSQQSGLAFQDSAGTLRFFTNIPCGSAPQVALEIRRRNATN
jgi:hypothetical protein